MPAWRIDKRPQAPQTFTASKCCSSSNDPTGLARPVSRASHARSWLQVGMKKTHVWCCRSHWPVLHLLQGDFTLDGVFPEVRDNVELVQGLFSKSLPPFLAGHYRKRHPRDVTFLHIDCDLYHGECSVFIHSMQSDTRACLHSAAWSLRTLMW